MEKYTSCLVKNVLNPHLKIQAFSLKECVNIDVKTEIQHSIITIAVSDLTVVR